MKDIRIIAGRDIRPDAAASLALAGYGKDAASQAQGKALFAELERPVRQAVRPKAALAFSDDGQGRTGLYAVLTAGPAVSRQAAMYVARKEYSEAVLFSAMADSCLFSFERQLGEAIRGLCREKGCGIASRHEAGVDCGFSLQEQAVQAVEAGRTLGVTLTEHHMLQPEKSMAILYELTDDPDVFHIEHDCRRCGNASCALRKEETQEEYIRCPKGMRISRWLRQQGYMDSFPCGETGRCGKCRVRVAEGIVAVSPEDRELFTPADLAAGWRLACKAVPSEDVQIVIPKRNRGVLAALGRDGDDYEADIGHSYGLAVDIGTTTLALSLVDTTAGRTVHTITAANSQRAFGADVVSRIQAAKDGKGPQLRKAVCHDLQQMFHQMWDTYPQAKDRCLKAAVAGNTTMLHLLMGWDCGGLGSWPFRPVSLGGDWYSWKDVFGEYDGFSNQPVALLPCISTYVGADITAGIWACSLMKSEETTLLIDLGTNGEMVLRSEAGLLTTATAAGPALEGGSLQWGTASVPGAICGVTMNGIRPKVRTIDGAPPVGICGTGVIEALAGLIETGLVDTTGKLKEPYFRRGFPFATTLDCEQIVMTQKDIREVQLAKSAIRAGIETLLCEGRMTCEDIDRVYIAGGFGYYLQPAKAAAIGLLPPQLVHKTAAAGNTSLAGAAAVLADESVLDDMKKICRHAGEVILANNDFFQSAYIEHMNF